MNDQEKLERRRAFPRPVWVRNRCNGPHEWMPAWARADYSEWTWIYSGAIVGTPIRHHQRDEFRERDPNNADGSDRPDLLETPS